MSLEELYAKCGWDYSRISGNMLSEPVMLKLINESSLHFGDYFKEVYRLIKAGDYEKAKIIINDILATSNFLGFTSISLRVEDLRRCVNDNMSCANIMISFENAYQQYELMNSLIKTSSQSFS